MDENRRPDWMGLLGMLATGVMMFGTSVLASAVCSCTENPRFSSEVSRGNGWGIVGPWGRNILIVWALFAALYAIVLILSLFCRRK